MSRHLITILISLLCFKALFSQTFDCSTGFEFLKSSICSQLSTTEYNCVLVDNECKEGSIYTSCEEYTPTGSFDDDTCEKIKPSNHLKKCSVNSQGGSKTCEMVYINCEESSEKECTGINRGTGKRCIFKGEGIKCEEHSDSCTGLNQDNCEKNIPSDASKKCSWDGAKCNEVNRKCDEYILFQDSTTYSYNDLCYKLEADSSKKCIYTENKKCEQVYPTCEPITDSSECEKAKPLVSN